MAGVREKKKARTQEAIMNAAIEMFAKNGYEATTIEQIAEKAVVGVGTVYNYFGSKRGLLVGFVEKETTHQIELGSEMINQPADTPEEAICNLLTIYTDDWMKYDKRLMREIMIAVLAEPESLGVEVLKFDHMLMGQIAALVKNFQESGKVSGDLPVEKIALIIYSYYGMMLMGYVSGMCHAELFRSEVKSGIRILFKQWSND